MQDLPLNETRSEPSTQTKQSWWLTIAVQIFCLSWIVPVIYLLVSNQQHHVTGARAWCPRGHCWVDELNNQAGITDYNITEVGDEGKDVLFLLQLASL
jgi:hypothetical protein